MPETWMTYAELAEALGTTAEAARQKAIRGRWRRQLGNDGKARILVDLEAEKAAHTPRKRPDERPDGRPDEHRTVEALEAHIDTLKEALAVASKQAEAASTRVDQLTGELVELSEQQRQEAEAASKRIDDLVGELVEMAKRMADQTAVADNLRTEFEAYRARPWWRRLAS
jgi:methyl-accepting chemotaxis protein